MYISEEQIKTVIKVLRENAHKIFMYSEEDVYMREVAIDIINKLNGVIYNRT